ncbi:MAG: hypothetical protein ISS19_03890 [Bacteroidales bacterium]|nr:hypothetical protein [Bacteroidales bacterium]
MSKDNFILEQRKHQIIWRKTNISTTEKGFQNGKDYEHIIPKNKWKETLWSGIRTGLPAYLDQKNIQHHTGTHNLLSSWIVCANLYFPVRLNKSLQQLMLAFLKQRVSSEITEIEEVELEFAFPEKDGLHPSLLLGELDGNRGSGQTSPDVAFIVKTPFSKGIVLTECKYTEHSFYKCSARRTIDKGEREGNPNPTRCMQSRSVIDYKTICHQTIWGRKYWNNLHLSNYGRTTLKRCPAATAGYQLFRQQALAEGIRKSSEFSLVASSVAFDARNNTLIECLKSTGINDFQTEWAKLFDGKAIFKTWTHQEWVQFVRANQVNGEFNNWLGYLNKRYGY